MTTDEEGRLIKRFLHIAVGSVGTLYAFAAVAQESDGDLDSRDSETVVDALGEYGQSLVEKSQWPIVYDHDRLIVMNGGGYTMSFHIETDRQGHENSTTAVEGFTGLPLGEKRSRWLAEVCTPELGTIIKKYQQTNIGLVISPRGAGGPDVVAYATSCVFE